MKRYVSFMLLCIAYTHSMDRAIISQKFDMLPLELNSRIIKDVFNWVIYENAESKKDIDQEKLKQHILGIPIVLGIKFCNEFHQFQTLCQSEIGGKRFLARELFVLPRKQRDVFIRVANRSFLSYGDIYADDCAIIAEEMQEEIKKGLNFGVNLMNKKVENIQLLGGFCTLAGAVTMVFINPAAQISIRLVPIVGVIGGFGLIGLSEILNFFNENYRKDDSGWFIKKVTL